MNILIVEDEKPAAERLCRLLHKLDPDIYIMNITQSIEETVNWLVSQRLPELIFMDIQLDDGLCFEIFDIIELDVPVIFTTAYNEYALKAFKVNSIDYLLKPISESDLSQALNKHKKLSKNEVYIDNRIKKAIQDLNKSYRNRFLVKVGPNYKSIPVTEVSHFFIRDKGTYMHINSNHEFALDYSLDQIMVMIDPNRFYRINRSCIINIDAITQLKSYSSSRLQISMESLKDNELLVVSRDRVSDFKKWMDR
ncbi:response regulator transcription factor [Labilibacter sediminis]|nr:response regulator transcription factor [Labilibacter sediminis]